jgi:predicted nucleic acid-binding Zn ribbon protein
MSHDNYSNYPEYENREEFEAEFTCPRCGEMRPDDNDLCSECRAEELDAQRERLEDAQGDVYDVWRERWDQAN